MQRQEDGYSRLKRVILIGDHHQLPPVVKNMAFQKYSHLDQSLFTRFIRLGTPYIQLNAQVGFQPFCSQIACWLGSTMHVDEGHSAGNGSYLQLNKQVCFQALWACRHTPCMCMYTSALLFADHLFHGLMACTKRMTTSALQVHVF